MVDAWASVDQGIDGQLVNVVNIWLCECRRSTVQLLTLDSGWLMIDGAWWYACASADTLGQTPVTQRLSACIVCSYCTQDTE